MGKLKKSPRLLYCIIFALMACCIFWCFAVYHRVGIYSLDGVCQHFPWAIKTKRVFQQVLVGNFNFWSWESGMGSDTIGFFASCLFNPLYWLPAFFSNKNIDIAFSISIVLQMFLAGFVMTGYMNYKKKETWKSVVAGILYAFSPWMLGIFRQPSFIWPTVLFVLLIWGSDKIINGEKGTLLILACVLLFITSPYFAFQAGIITGIYCIVQIVVKRKTICIKTMIAKLVLSVVIALLISAPILIPILVACVNCSSDSGIIFGFFHSIKSYFLYIPGVLYGGELIQSYDNVGMFSLSLVLFPSIIINIRKKNIESIMVLVLTIIMFFPYLSSLMNIGSYPMGRFAFCYAFFVIVATLNLVDSKVNIKKAMGILFICVIYSIIVCNLILNILSINSMLFLLINSIFAFAIGWLLYENREIKLTKKLRLGRNAVLVILCILNVIIYWNVAFNISYAGRLQKFLEAGKINKLFSNSELKKTKLIDDNDFYRVSSCKEYMSGQSRNNSNNADLYWNVPSITINSTLASKPWHEFNTLMNNNDDVYRSGVIGTNERTRMNYIESVKYAAKASDTGYGFVKDSDNIYKSKYAMGLGANFSKCISKSEFEKMTAIEREQVLTQALVVDDGLAEKYGKLIVSKSTLQYDHQTLKPFIYSINNGCQVTGNSITINRSNAGIKFKVQNVKRSEIYVEFKNLQRVPFTEEEIQLQYAKDGHKESAIGKEKRLLASRYGQQYIPIQFTVDTGKKGVYARNSVGVAQGTLDKKDYFINTGYYTAFDNEISIKFGYTGKYTYDAINVYVLPVEPYEKQATELQTENIKVSKKDSDHMIGKVNTKEDGILFLSIPYAPGWKAYVDGKETEIIPNVDIMFSGLSIKAGSHKVELIYRPPYYKQSLLSCFLGVSLGIISIVIGVLKKRKSKTTIIQDK